MTTWLRSDDDDDPAPQFSRADIIQVKDLLAKLEEHGPVDAAKFQVLKRVITTFETHSAEIEAMILDHTNRRLWAELRVKWLATIKWVLGGLVVIMGAVQTADSVFPIVRKWFGGSP